MAKRFLLLLLGALIAGCGSGGGGGGGVTGGGVVGGGVAVDLSTQAPSVQTVIYGVQLTVRLPPGATVTADPVTGELAAGQLQVKDAAALASGRYLPATATAPASVRINIVDSTGLAPGDLATLFCQDTSGGAGTYALEGFSARDQNGVELAGVSGRFSVRTL